MNIKHGENADADPSNGPNATALEDERGTIARLGEEKNEKPEKTATLGVLLVHGIGSQRRGDTLVHCTTALHNWLRDWCWFKDPGTVDLVDVSISETAPDQPPQASIIFRRDEEISQSS